MAELVLLLCSQCTSIPTSKLAWHQRYQQIELGGLEIALCFVACNHPLRVWHPKQVREQEHPNQHLKALVNPHFVRPLLLQPAATLRVRLSTRYRQVIARGVNAAVILVPAQLADSWRIRHLPVGSLASGAAPPYREPAYNRPPVNILHELTAHPHLHIKVQ